MVHRARFRRTAVPSRRAAADGRVRLWNAGDRPPAARPSRRWAYAVNAIAFSPNKRIVAAGGIDGTIKLWDVIDGRELRRLTGHSDAVRTIAFSPDGKTLASGSADKTIRFWDAVSGGELFSAGGYATAEGEVALTPVSAVAFSPDGRILASAGGDGTVKLWDMPGRALVRVLIGHSGEVNAIAFSADGRSLASGSSDATVKLWDVSPVTQGNR